MKAFVPQGSGIDKRTGDSFTYGGYDVEMTECGQCDGVYADGGQHLETAYHKRRAS